MTIFEVDKKSCQICKTIQQVNFYQRVPFQNIVNQSPYFLALKLFFILICSQGY